MQTLSASMSDVRVFIPLCLAVRHARSLRSRPTKRTAIPPAVFVYKYWCDPLGNLILNLKPRVLNFVFLTIVFSRSAKRDRGRRERMCERECVCCVCVCEGEGGSVCVCCVCCVCVCVCVREREGVCACVCICGIGLKSSFSFPTAPH